MQPGAAPLLEISPAIFLMLNLALVPSASIEELVAAISIRKAAFATDHFLVYFLLGCDIEPRPQHQRWSKDRQASQNRIVRQLFTSTFVAGAGPAPEGYESVESSWHNLSQACSVAALELPQQLPAVDWAYYIRSGSAEACRTICWQRAAENNINKAVHKSVRADKAIWLNATLEHGTRAGIRKLRRRRKPNQGRLQDENGNLVSSECRADTMASNLKTVQWRVRPAT